MSKLNWEDFIEKVANCDWSLNTDEFIKLYPGVKDDDGSTPSYTVGSKGAAHAIVAGRVGAGKSVFVNNIIATLTKMYSPKELRLWLMDCKGYEFTFFKESERFPYALPHIDLCETVEDCKFSSEPFDKLRDEVDRRLRLLSDAEFNTVREHNKYLRDNGRESDTIPNIIFVMDEYQALFECADDEIIQRVNNDIMYISKVARKVGVHFFFSSQSMSKSLSSRIFEIFALRFVLRSSADVSYDFIGSNDAANIEEKYGYLYAKDGSSKEATKFRTPFISDDVLREHIRKMSDKAKEDNV